MYIQLMSGYANYSGLDNAYLYTVTVKQATPDNFKKYGNLINTIEDYRKEKVITVPWPRTAEQLPLMEGTGSGAGYVEDTFRFWIDREGNYRAHNLAVNSAASEAYITGQQQDNLIVTREFNFHPDGGQVFFNTCPTVDFILVLAPPTENVHPEDFEAFYFKGEGGCQINPNVWHQPPYPLTTKLETVEFMGKQGAVHACVGYDSMNKHNLLIAFSPDVPFSI
jgi:ureidoglycolate hydrolase